MKKFKLPRKTKKRLKKGLWLYPADEKGNSLMAWPTRIEKDYFSYKKGILRNLFESSKERRKAQREKLDLEVEVSDEVLKSYIEDLIRKDLRTSTFNILRRAKNNKNAVLAYYNFVNAYQLNASGERSFGNIACMSIDLAEKLLRVKK